MANQTLFVIFAIYNNISHMFAIQFNCHQNVNALFPTYSIALTFIIAFFLLLWPLQAYISGGDKDIYMDTMTTFNIIHGICRMSRIIFVSMYISFDAILGTHIGSTFALLAIIIIIFTTLSLFYSPNRLEIDSLSTNIDNFNDLTPINDVCHDTNENDAIHIIFLNRYTNDGMYNVMNTIQYKQLFILWLSQLYVWYSQYSVVLSTKLNSINTNPNDWLQFKVEVKPLCVKPSIPPKCDDSIVTSHEFALENQYTQQRICLLHGSNEICYDTELYCYTKYFIFGDCVNNLNDQIRTLECDALIEYDLRQKICTKYVHLHHKTNEFGKQKTLHKLNSSPMNESLYNLRSTININIFRNRKNESPSNTETQSNYDVGCMQYKCIENNKNNNSKEMQTINKNINHNHLIFDCSEIINVKY